jgi:hypothetical protein
VLAFVTMAIATIILPRMLPSLLWLPPVGRAVGPNVVAMQRGLAGNVLSARLENVAFVRAAGAASSLPFEAALIAFGVTLISAAVMARIRGIVEPSVQSNLAAGAVSARTPIGGRIVPMDTSVVEWSGQRRTHPGTMTNSAALAEDATSNSANIELPQLSQEQKEEILIDPQELERAKLIITTYTTAKDPNTDTVEII